MTKICSKCKIEQPIENFHHDKGRRDGLQCVCKSCYKKYQEEHREELYESHRRWRQENAEIIKTKKRKYYEENREEILQWFKDYRAENREETNSYFTERRQQDPEFKLRQNLRNRLNKVLKGSVKAGSAVRDLGCTIPELRAHLESKFQPGMTWENHGFGEGKWNVDHIMPLSVFDLTNRQHLLLACHYSNLQPLWHEENMSKGDTVPILENIPEEYLLLCSDLSKLAGETLPLVVDPIFGQPLKLAKDWQECLPA